MYYWKDLTDEERELILSRRKLRKFPWHSPPHLEFKGPVAFIISASCYLHKPVIGKSAERLEYCEDELLAACGKTESTVFAWCVLPNHYHFLVRTENIRDLRKEIGRFHGRSARYWNQEDSKPGRKVWFNFMDKDMKSLRHFWASLNYIHQNPVKHGYVKKWQDWKYSSASRFLNDFGRERAEFIWRMYPVLDYGAGWDDD